MKLCVFQGTFNPVHNAHLRVAEFVCENLGFDEVMFIPAYIPPHKDCEQDLAQHRLNMLKLATQDNPKFTVSDIEYRRKGKSYTILTIQELYKTYGKINFLIGTDAFDKIESWYKADELKKLVKFIVFKREDNFDISRYNYLKSDGYDFEIQTLPFNDISSSQLREMIKNNEAISPYVPSKVKEYIDKNGIYKL